MEFDRWTWVVQAAKWVEAVNGRSPFLGAMMMPRRGTLADLARGDESA